MENIKVPILHEDSLRTQRVEIYLNDLKARLKELRHQHDEVIQNSVDIIQEIDGVSSSLLQPEASVEQTTNTNRIKQLIKEFENAKQSTLTKTPVLIESKVDIQKILRNFEKLNESHVLKDSLMLFKRAKESFQKIDTFLNKVNRVEDVGSSVSTVGCNFGANNNFKNKLNMFNGRNEINKETNSLYASCCSSLMSVDTFHSTEDLGNFLAQSGPSTTTSLENGYEGDNDDSEYDLLAIKKKKSKCLPTN